MNKKILRYLKASLVASMALMLIISLSGCENQNENENNNENYETSVVNLQYVYAGDDDEKIELNASVKYPKDDEIREYSENDKDAVRIVNEKENYEVRLVLYEEAKGTYNANKEACKEYDEYTETKYGKYDAYYSKSGYSIVGCILLEGNDDENSYRHIAFDVSMVESYDDENEEWRDVTPIFKSTRIQNILKSIEYNVNHK